MVSPTDAKYLGHRAVLLCPHSSLLKKSDIPGSADNPFCSVTPNTFFFLLFFSVLFILRNKKLRSDRPTTACRRGTRLDVHSARLEGGPRLVDPLLGVLAPAGAFGLSAVARVFYILGGSLGLAVLDFDREWELTGSEVTKRFLVGLSNFVSTRHQPNIFLRIEGWPEIHEVSVHCRSEVKRLVVVIPDVPVRREIIQQRQSIFRSRQRFL